MRYARERDDTLQPIERTSICMSPGARSAPYSQSSEGGVLTFRKSACFPAVMTQRNIHRPAHTTARTAARVASRTAQQRVNLVIANTALAVLVLVVVVLITSPTGAG